MDDKYKCSCMKSKGEGFIEEACATIEAYLQAAFTNHAICPQLGLASVARVFGSMTYDAITNESEREAFYAAMQTEIENGRLHAQREIANEEGQRVDH